MAKIVILAIYYKHEEKNNYHCCHIWHACSYCRCIWGTRFRGETIGKKHGGMAHCCTIPILPHFRFDLFINTHSL